VGSFKGVTGRVQVLTEVDDVSLDIERATPCGLIVNELVTNSFKYAFEGRASGVVRVGFHRVADTCTMQIGDDGNGLPPSAGLDSTSGTLGLRLVQTLAEQLGATVDTQRQSGTCFTFRFSCAPP
jgi:two-component sensor histidine kinase